MTGSVHRITSADAFVNVLRQAQQQGQYVRLGAGGQTLEVDDMPTVPRARRPSTQLKREQQAVAGRLNELVQSQLWAVVYGTGGPSGPSMREREARAGMEPLPMAQLMRGSGGGEPTLFHQMQAEDPALAHRLGSALGVLQELAGLAGRERILGFAEVAARAMREDFRPLSERLRELADAALPLINEFGYLGDVAGGTASARFKDMMEKLAQALMLAADTRADQAQIRDEAQVHEAAARRQSLQGAQQRQEAAQQVGRSAQLARADLSRTMAEQASRQAVEKQLDRQLRSAMEAVVQRGAVAQDAAEAAFEHALYDALGQAQERLLTPREDEGDVQRWQAAAQLLEPHREALAERGQRLDAFEEFAHPSALGQAPQQGGREEPSTPPAKTEAQRDLQNFWQRVAGGLPAWRPPGWTQAAATLAHVRTGQSALANLEVLAQQMSRSLEDGLRSVAGQISRSSARISQYASMEKVRQMMAAYASAMAELDFGRNGFSLQRLRAACHHVIPHLGTLDAMLGMAAAMDDFETVERLYCLRRCLLTAQEQVLPVHLTYQAAPLPPEVMRELGRSMAAAAIGAQHVSAGLPSLDATGLKSPEEKTAYELLKASGDVLLRTVKAVLEGLARSALAQREGSALGATLRSALERLESSSNAGTLLDRLTLSYAILTAVAPALESASAQDVAHAHDIKDLLAAVEQARSALFSVES